MGLVLPKSKARPVLPANTTHVAILGDSNAYGAGDTDQLDDRTLINAFASATINQVLGFGTMTGGNVEYNIATQSLQPFHAGGASGMGPELSLGRLLYQLGRTPVHISKWCSRGSSLGIEWPVAAANYYPLVTAYLDARVIEHGPIGVIYFDLGSNDCAAVATANAWLSNFQTLVGALRARYGQFTAVIRQTSQIADPTYPYFETVRGNQYNYIDNDPNALLIGCDDIPRGSDLLHFPAANLLVLGDRIGIEIAQRLGPATPGFAGGFPEFYGAGPGIYGAGTLTPLPCPSPVVDGSHYEILQTATGFIDGATAPTLTEAAGFTLINSQRSRLAGAPNADQWLALWWRRVTSRRMQAPIVADNNNVNAAKIWTFRSPTTKVGSPIDISVFSKNDAYAAPISVTGGTTTIANDLVAIFMSSYGGSQRTTSGWANASLGSLTVQGSDLNYPVGSDLACMTLVTGTKAAIGAFVATTATASGPMIQACAAIAFKP